MATTSLSNGSPPRASMTCRSSLLHGRPIEIVLDLDIFANDPRRDSNHHRMRRHVVNNYGIGPDDGARSDSDRAQDFSACSDKALIFNHRHCAKGGTMAADRDLLADVPVSADAAAVMKNHPHPPIANFPALPDLRIHA